MHVFVECVFLVFKGKRGPVYAVQWSPNSKEFCVVYGCILLFNEWQEGKQCLSLVEK